MSFYLAPYSRRAMRQMLNSLNDNSWANIAFPMDVKVEDEAYVISALLPGIAPEDLDIQVVNETVTLKGEYRSEQVEGEQYLLKERPMGRFARTLQLPERLDAVKAEAKMDNGVLTLRIPRAEDLRPRTIKVNVN